jgi:hypothetical protein
MSRKSNKDSSCNVNHAFLYFVPSYIGSGVGSNRSDYGTQVICGVFELAMARPGCPHITLASLPYKCKRCGSL